MSETKFVLISVRPKWCEKIASGEKTIEVRKSRPKVNTPFKCHIYCTKEKVLGELLLTSSGMVEGRNKGFRNEGDIPLGGKVIGEFVCDKIYQYSTGNIEGQTISSEEMQKQSRLTDYELCDYETSAEPRENCIYRIGLYGWHISALQIYDKPMELRELGVSRAPQSWGYVYKQEATE